MSNTASKLKVSARLQRLKKLKEVILLPFRINYLISLQEKQVMLLRDISNQLQIQSEKTNNKLISFEASFYSQNGEDGVIEELLNLIEKETQIEHTFLEVGVGDGTENNTRYLNLKGWTGIWIDGSEQNEIKINQNLPAGITFERKIITPSNVKKTLDELQKTVDFDLFRPTVLSIDIDSDDLPVTNEFMKHCEPVIVIVEYNAAVGFAETYYEDGDPVLTYEYARDDYGASLTSWVKLLEDRYDLVYCDASGTNAIFTHKEYTPNNLLKNDIKKLFKPARYYAGNYNPKAGNKRSLYPVSK